MIFSDILFLTLFSFICSFTFGYILLSVFGLVRRSVW